MSNLMLKQGVVLFLIIFLCLSCANTPSAKLRIAVAANMQYAIQPIIDSFTKETGIPCELIVGSSGKLTAQIKAGAPFDLFLSADLKFPNELYQSGFATEKPKIYAYGQLVLWTLNDQKPSFDWLTNPIVHHIAMANPKTAPYGKVTKELLNNYGIYSQLKDKLVFGESIAQTTQFIVSKAADIGFTSKSMVLSSNLKGKGSWIDINKTHYTPPAQGIIIIKKQKTSHENAEKFYNFLSSALARKILLNFGYSIK